MPHFRYQHCLSRNQDDGGGDGNLDGSIDGGDGADGGSLSKVEPLLPHPIEWRSPVMTNAEEVDLWTEFDGGGKRERKRERPGSQV